MIGKEQNKELIKKLHAKTKEYLIPKNPEEGQEQITIHLKSIAIEDSSEFEVDVQKLTDKERIDHFVKMIAYCMGVNEEDVKQIEAAYAADLLEAVLDVNHLNKKSQQDKISRIKNIQLGADTN